MNIYLMIYKKYIKKEKDELFKMKYQMGMSINKDKANTNEKMAYNLINK